MPGEFGPRRTLLRRDLERRPPAIARDHARPSITSSALASSVAGTPGPNRLALLKLITSSTVGCSMRAPLPQDHALAVHPGKQQRDAGRIEWWAAKSNARPALTDPR
jgi:hypothetical protein